MHADPRHLKNIERDRLVRLLEQRFGDGTCFFHGPEDHIAFGLAQDLGLVSVDGLVTAEGKRFSAVHAIQ